MRGTTEFRIWKYQNGQILETTDVLAHEAPLQMLIRHGKLGARKTENLAMTMRTPGNDDLLVTGYLYAEGIIATLNDIAQIKFLDENTILIELHHHVVFNPAEHDRGQIINSSCGLCGKKSMRQIKDLLPYLLKKTEKKVSIDDLLQWTKQLHESQRMFKNTGGSHAVSLFESDKLLTTCEDVGRHNAMDKVIGFALNQLKLPLDDCGVLVSGRASFELVQKALMGGIPVLAAIGAPSSLALQLADENNMTLVGFLKEGQCNIYSHAERLG